MTITREYYRIRFPAKVGTRNEWHSSNNGTDRWGTLREIKSVLTRGIRCGYKGQIREDFIGHEVVKITETVDILEEIIAL